MTSGPEPEPTVTAATDVCLALSDVSVSVQDDLLLRGVNLTVDPGEIVTISGPSGCGKTTLLRAVSGLIPSAGGTISLRGRSLMAWGPPAFRRRVVYVHQRPVLLDERVLDNLQRPFSYGSATSCFDRARAEEMLERFRLGPDRLEQMARSLSEGEQQRVSVIRALLLEPEILLLDEPTSSLDADTADIVRSVLSEVVAEKRLGILAVTHNQNATREWAHRNHDLAENAVPHRSAQGAPA